jgi:hypothetical protein
MMLVTLIRTLQFTAFPPRQKSASFRIDQVMQKLQEGGGK